VKLRPDDITGRGQGPSEISLVTKDHQQRGNNGKIGGGKTETDYRHFLVRLSESSKQREEKKKIGTKRKKARDIRRMLSSNNGREEQIRTYLRGKGTEAWKTRQRPT